MYFSNATLQELVREAEESQNELALRLYDKVKNDLPSEDSVIFTRSEAKRAEIFEWAVNATNDPLKTFTLDLLKAVFDAKGGKRKTLEAIQQFRLCCETDIMGDEAELLEHFVNDVPDKFEEYVK
nr:MAG TPA: hypothetical protein [Caudoviricetes sp.]